MQHAGNIWKHLISFGVWVSLCLHSEQRRSQSKAGYRRCWPVAMRILDITTASGLRTPSSKNLQITGCNRSIGKDKFTERARVIAVTEARDGFGRLQAVAGANIFGNLLASKNYIGQSNCKFISTLWCPHKSESCCSNYFEATPGSFLHRGG